MRVVIPCIVSGYHVINAVVYHVSGHLMLQIVDYACSTYYVVYHGIPRITLYVHALCSGLVSCTVSYFTSNRLRFLQHRAMHASKHAYHTSHNQETTGTVASYHAILQVHDHVMHYERARPCIIPLFQAPSDYNCHARHAPCCRKISNSIPARYPTTPSTPRGDHPFPLYDLDTSRYIPDLYDLAHVGWEPCNLHDL